MILQALDTIHVSSVSSDNIITGQVFEIDDQAGRSLIERGLAIETDAAALPKAPVVAAKAAQDTPAGAEVAQEAPAAAVLAEQVPVSNKSGANTRHKAV